MAKTAQTGSTGIEQTGQHPVNVFNDGHGYYTGGATQGSTVDTTKPEFVDGNRTPTVGARGNTSDSGEYKAQLVPYKFHRLGVMDIYKDMTWQQICSDTVGLESHSGTEITGYRYLPLLDDRNKNDQGIDVTGVQIENGNLYGSSKDPGTINENMPLLGEFGGRIEESHRLAA